MKKENLISGILTILIIGLLILSGPAKAIDVEIITEDISPGDLFKTFIIKIVVHDGEFLPIPFVDLIFNDGINEISCRIEGEGSDCDFLNIDIDTEDLNYGYGYGYGYGGYGYGYGYSTFSPGYYIYKVILDISKLPESFDGKNVGLEVKVFGSDDSSYSSDSSFNVFVPMGTSSYGGGGKRFREVIEIPKDKIDECKKDSDCLDSEVCVDICCNKKSGLIEKKCVAPEYIEKEDKYKEVKPIPIPKNYGWLWITLLIVVAVIGIGYYVFKKE